MPPPTPPPPGLGRARDSGAAKARALPAANCPLGARIHRYAIIGRLNPGFVPESAGLGLRGRRCGGDLIW